MRGAAGINAKAAATGRKRSVLDTFGRAGVMLTASAGPLPSPAPFLFQLPSPHSSLFPLHVNVVDLRGKTFHTERGGSNKAQSCGSEAGGDLLPLSERRAAFPPSGSKLLPALFHPALSLSPPPSPPPPRGQLSDISWRGGTYIRTVITGFKLVMLHLLND